MNKFNFGAILCILALLGFHFLNVQNDLVIATILVFAVTGLYYMAETFYE